MVTFISSSKAKRNFAGNQGDSEFNLSLRSHACICSLSNSDAHHGNCFCPKPLRPVGDTNLALSVASVLVIRVEVKEAFILGNGFVVATSSE